MHHRRILEGRILEGSLGLGEGDSELGDYQGWTGALKGTCAGPCVTVVLVFETVKIGPGLRPTESSNAVNPSKCQRSSALYSLIAAMSLRSEFVALVR